MWCPGISLRRYLQLLHFHHVHIQITTQHRSWPPHFLPPHWRALSQMHIMHLRKLTGSVGVWLGLLGRDFWGPLSLGMGGPSSYVHVQVVLLGYISLIPLQHGHTGCDSFASRGLPNQLGHLRWRLHVHVGPLCASHPLGGTAMPNTCCRCRRRGGDHCTLTKGPSSRWIGLIFGGCVDNWPLTMYKRGGGESLRFDPCFLVLHEFFSFFSDRGVFEDCCSQICNTFTVFSLKL